MKYRLDVWLMAGFLAVAGLGADGQGVQSVTSPGVAGRTDSNVASGPVVLDWTPPALAQLSNEATTKSSFTLDRNMLNVAAGMMPDTDAPTKEAINKVDGVSVHLLRFGAGIPEFGSIDAIRQAYHLRGWKHVVTNSDVLGSQHNTTTDVWVVMDGVNLRGAVVLAETPRSVTLVTVAGNLSPIDLLHLRGHFGIPKFNSDGMVDLKNQ